MAAGWWRTLTVKINGRGHVEPGFPFRRGETDMDEKPPEKHPIPRDFRDAVTELLFQSQMIEQMLKTVLYDIAEIAELSLRGQVRFRYDRKDKRTLGMLTKAFGVHALDDAFVQRLQAFMKQRNLAAHAAYVWGYIHAENEDTIRETTARVNRHIIEAEALLELVTLESLRLYELRQKYKGWGDPASIAHPPA